MKGDELPGGIALACPSCGSPLGGQEPPACPSCGRGFPRVAGVLDLRLTYSDPSVTTEEDEAVARRLSERFDELDLADLLREHWRLIGRPPELVERFVHGDLGAAGRAQAYLAEIERVRGARLGPGDRFLEVGCGTAALAVAAAERCEAVVAGDVSLRWLVLARKRLSEGRAQGVALLCFAAEDPPFPAGSFDVVAASDVIEHAESQDAFVAGLARVLRPGGLLFLATPNRFSLGLEPHVRLWGVGFLPRGLARRYVRAVRRTGYEHVHLLSARRLRRLLEKHGLAARVVPPAIPEASQRLYRGPELWLVRAYNRLRRLGPVGRLLLAIGPFFHVYGRKPGE